MSFIAQYFQEEFIYAMGWTVLHSFWQGIAIALIMAVVLASLQGRSARLRYEIASFSLFLMLVSAVCTFIYLYDHSSSTMTAAALDATTVHIIAPAGGESGGLLNGFFQTCNTYFNDHLPLIVSVWLLGMAFFLLRLLGGLAYVQGLRNRHNRPMEEFWQHKMKGLASRMRIRRPVALLESAQVKVPMVIGYLKPAILMPLGAINQLNMNEVEAILAHELAHIRRNDYLLNILIAMIEALFYYNPAVWWMAANIRSERENCCDDLAIQVCGNSLTYAKALVRIQELHQASIPAFAMSFSGNKKQLLHRIRRILNQPQNRSHIREKLGATCLLLMMILFVSMGAGPSQQEDNQQSSEWIEVESFEPTTVFFESSTEQTDSLPPPKKKSKTKAHYFKETDGRKVELKIEDGEVVELKINGEAIPPSERDKYGDIVSELQDVPAPPKPPAPPVPPTPPAPPTPPMPPTPPAPSAPPAPPAPSGTGFGWLDTQSLPSRTDDDLIFRFDNNDAFITDTKSSAFIWDSNGKRDTIFLNDGKIRSNNKESLAFLWPESNVLLSSPSGFSLRSNEATDDWMTPFLWPKESKKQRKKRMKERKKRMKARKKKMKRRKSKKRNSTVYILTDTIRPLVGLSEREEMLEQYREATQEFQELMQDRAERMAEAQDIVTAEGEAMMRLQKEELDAFAHKMEEQSLLKDHAGLLELEATQYRENQTIYQNQIEELRESAEQLQEEAKHLQKLEQRELEEYLKQAKKHKRGLIQMREQSEIMKKIALEMKSKQFDRLEQMEEQLLKDGLIKSTKSYSIKLDNKTFQVNGKKQSAKVHEKYYYLYKDMLGNMESGKLEIRKGK